VGDDKMKMEKVPVMIVYKEGEHMKIKSTRNTNHFELFGFLKTYLIFLEDEMVFNMHENTKNKPVDDDMDDSEFFI
jgi:hypothetical protein